MRDTLTAIADLPGIADVTQKKRVPKGFYAKMGELIAQYERYDAAVHEAWGTRDDEGDGDGWIRPGTPNGKYLCQSAPTPVSGIESLALYRHVRTLRDFERSGRILAEQGQQLFEDLQRHNRSKKPEELKLSGASLRQGRRDYAQRGQLCPFFDVQRGRCKIWDQRPLACRQYRVRGPVEWTDPRHAEHTRLETRNLRLPIKIQVELRQLEKRMGLQVSPFLSTGVMQLLHLADGTTIPEVGEPAARIRKDGTLDQRANRNSKNVKKTKKKRK